MNRIQLVETALDRYITAMTGRGIDPEGVRVVTLAQFAPGKITPSQMGHFLQSYRRAQKRGTTKYVIAAEGYGTAARWKLLAKPGSRQAVVQANRTKHTKFVSHDLAARLTSDLIHEVRPGLTVSADDADIAHVMTLVESQIASLITFVDTTLA